MNGQHRGADVDAALARIRGALPVKRTHARDIAADLDHPGCGLRALMDAAGIDKARIAERLDHPMPEEQSPAALRRGNHFERIVTENGMAHLLAELRKQLDLPITEAREKDLSGSGLGLRGEAEMRARAKATRAALRLILDPDAAYNVLRHPVTTLERAGRIAYLEQDALAFKVGAKLHVVEIKGFNVIAGVPTDEMAIRGAAGQSAVYVLSLQQTLAAAGLDPDLVSTTIILITAKGYGLTPTSHTLDVRNQLKALRRQLARRVRIDDILADLPDDLTFDVADQDQLHEKVLQVPFHYVPGCLSSCSMARVCRERCVSGDMTDRLGTSVRNDLGELQTIGDALAAARSGTSPTDENAADVARALHMANDVYLAAGGAA